MTLRRVISQNQVPARPQTGIRRHRPLQQSICITVLTGPRSCSSVPSTQHSEKPLGLGKGLGKGLAPRPKAKKAQPAPAAPLFPGFGRGFGAVPPDIGDQDELSANFQKMMAELAHGAQSHTAKSCFTSMVHISTCVTVPCIIISFTKQCMKPLNQQRYTQGDTHADCGSVSHPILVDIPRPPALTAMQAPHTTASTSDSYLSFQF